jgi:ABC-2 type transport system ATP-binding protein
VNAPLPMSPALETVADAAPGAATTAGPAAARARSAAVTLPANELIRFDDVSKFYGEVLGINRVTLTLPPGITSLVGPNGAGKTTLMNLLTGLLQPSRGRLEVLGVPTSEPWRLGRIVGYCPQFDSFPRAITGWGLVEGFLRLHGFDAATSRRLAAEAIERVGMTAAAGRKVAGYSKGMRQRIKLAQAIAHHPRVLVLDEPLNGLDPMARAEVMALFADLARGGLHVLISSHILHEVDKVSDRVVLLDEGYVVAEGAIGGVRGEMEGHPMQVLVRAERAPELAAQLITEPDVVEIRLHDDRRGLLLRTRDAERLFARLQQLVVSGGFAVDAVYPADEDVQAVYDYLIGSRAAWTAGENL